MYRKMYCSQVFVGIIHKQNNILTIFCEKCWLVRIVISEGKLGICLMKIYIVVLLLSHSKIKK